MPQQSCPWCGHCGPRYDEGTVASAVPGAHDDGTSCVCRHLTAASRLSAAEVHGRYWDATTRRWLCFGCGTAPNIVQSVAVTIGGNGRKSVTFAKNIANELEDAFGVDVRVTYDRSSSSLSANVDNEELNEWVQRQLRNDGVIRFLEQHD